MQEAAKITPPEELSVPLNRLQEYFTQWGEPNMRLNPRWLAKRLDVNEREMLGALAYAVRNGTVEMLWEAYCPDCGHCLDEFESLRDAVSQIECGNEGCQQYYDMHLDRDVHVTFSVTQRMRRKSGRPGEVIPLTDNTLPPTRGLDLIVIPAFWDLFAGECPDANETIRIGRVVILFTDLRGSTAMYADRGDARAYRLVRDHFAILFQVIDRHRGAVIKTIGDAVMATFTSGADAVRAAFDSQVELHARANDLGGELALKAGVHAGACLSVTLNERLDFFGTAVNTAARVQTLSNGNDVVITDCVLADLEEDAEDSPHSLYSVETFEATLRGLPAPTRVHRISGLILH
jgi:class 3 adenylate cyclase